MRAAYATISKAVRHLQQLQPTVKEFTGFKRHLAKLIARTEEVRKTARSGALEETVIDRLVYELYRLMEEVVDVVEGSGIRPRGNGTHGILQSQTQYRPNDTPL